MALWIATSARPDSIVADPGFIVLLNGLNARYKVPSRSTIHRKVENVFEQARVLVAKKVNKAKGIAATMDGVTLTQNSKKYLVGTIHFFDEEGVPNSISIGVCRLKEKNTGMYLKDCILSMLNNIGIDPALVKYITTDGATNMVDAARLLGWTRIWCVCHVIHLTVTDAINNCMVPGAGSNPPSRLRDLFNNIKVIVTFVKQSSVQAALHEKTEGKGLIQSVMTRWNTDLDMIERFLELFTVLTEILLQQSSSPTLPTMEEIRELREVVMILTPFKVIY